MVKWFFAETERLLPEMHRGLQRGDVVELGRLAHRLKGTVVYLGARRAVDAAQRAERFVAGGSLGDADEAVHALERECEALKTALIDYQLEHPTGPQRKDQEENER
jgi:HPt (histidine-containing phosphotransfer) domain-containing protein